MLERSFVGLAAILLSAHAAVRLGAVNDYDVAIYAATPAGIAGSIAAASTTSAKVVLIEPTAYVGGMSGPGGIGLRDLGTVARINSTALQWAMLNAKHYNQTDPVWQPDFVVGNNSFWTMLGALPNLDVVLSERVVERTGVTVTSGRVTSLVTAGPDGTGPQRTTFRAKYVIDASYEGDVLRFAGGSFTFGRESQTTYNESYAGVTGISTNTFKYQVPAAWPNGTLLHWVQDLPDPRKIEGEADDNVMAYSFRLCLTAVEDNKVNHTAPPGYSTEFFELSRRYTQLLQQHGDDGLYTPWGNLPYRAYPPGNKFDACCGNAPVGIDAAGLARGYSNGTYAEREAIKAMHRFYVQGLAYFWSYDPNSGIPDAVREEHQKYGLCKDQWPENGHFPPQLYVREASRMIGDRVFTQQDRIESTLPGGCRNDSIGLGSWGFDIHQMERVPVLSSSSSSELVAFNEGLTSPGLGHNVVFDLPYWLLLPKRSELTNVLVPNCPSISHVAFAAVREEPTLWQLGQAAGTAAALAALSSDQPAVQDVDVTAVQHSLLQQGLHIHWPVRDNCSAPIPTPCTAYTVAGAGSSDCNGKYVFSGDGTWTMDDEHAVYMYEGTWHIGYSGHTIYYAASGFPEAPPLTGWTAVSAKSPGPTLTCEKSA